MQVRLPVWHLMNKSRRDLPLLLYKTGAGDGLENMSFGIGLDRSRTVFAPPTPPASLGVELVSWTFIRQNPGREGTILALALPILFCSAKADSQIPSTCFSIANSTLVLPQTSSAYFTILFSVLPRLTLRFQAYCRIAKPDSQIPNAYFSIARQG